MKKKQIVLWDKEIAVLEEFFKDAVLPTKPIMLNVCSQVLNARLFVDTHLSVVKKNNGIHNFMPYLMRLQELMKILPTLPKEDAPPQGLERFVLVDESIPEQKEEVVAPKQVIVPAPKKERAKKKSKPKAPKEENNNGELNFE